MPPVLSMIVLTRQQLTALAALLREKHKIREVTVQVETLPSAL